MARSASSHSTDRIFRGTWTSGGPESHPRTSGDLLGPRTGVGTSLRTTKPEPNPQLPPHAHLPPASQSAARGEQGSSVAGAARKAPSPARAKHRPRAPSCHPRTRRSRPGRRLRGRSGPAGRGLLAEPAGTRAGLGRGPSC